MVVTKSEMVAAIRKVKSVIPKISTIPALMGALVNDGYLIATNTEISIQVKLEAGAGEKFILPSKALDMICNLPDGNVKIECGDKNIITISAGRIKNKIQSVPVEEFAYDDIRNVSEENATIDAEKFLRAISRVAFAADAKSSNRLMTGIYLEGVDDGLKMAALDGHRIARIKIPATGVEGMKLIIPKQACEILSSLDLHGKIDLSYDNYAAVFCNEDSVVYTRLISGEYFNTDQMFRDSPIRATIDRKEFSNALTRANMCINSEKSKVPVVLDISRYEMEVSIVNSTNDYKEVVQLAEDINTPIRIGFNPKLINEALKYFSDDEVCIELTTPKMPMFVSETNTDLRVLILPVNIAA